MALTQVSDAGLVKPASDLQDNEKIVLGTGNDLEIYHSGTNTFIANSTGPLKIRSDVLELGAANGEQMLQGTADAAVNLYHNGIKKFETGSHGISVTGYISCSGSSYGYTGGDNVKLSLGNSNDLQIYHDGNNSKITDSGTGVLAIGGSAVYIEAADHGETLAKFIDDGAVNLYYNGVETFRTAQHGAVVTAGEGQNTELFFYADEGDDNADSWKFVAFTNPASTFDLYNLTSGSWEKNISCVGNGGVELWYDNVKKFETHAVGIKAISTTNECNLLLQNDARTWKIVNYDYSGSGGDHLGFHDGTADRLIIQNDGHVHLPADSQKLVFGAGDDLEIYHSGTQNFIDSVNNTNVILRAGTGTLYLQGNDVLLGDEGATEKYIDCHKDGAVELYYDNSKKIETYTYGVKTEGHVWLSRDNDKAYFGAGSDLEIYHDGNNTWIKNSTGQLKFETADSLQIFGSNSETLADFHKDGACNLYYDNVKKLETTSSGVQITGKLLAHQTSSDSDWTSGTRHVLQSNVSDAAAVVIEHSDDTAPYGLYIDFSDDDPDNNTRWFAACADSSATRFRIYSDGDAWTSDAGTLTSDQTLKENITDATSKLEDLKKIKVRNFNWKSSFHPEKSKKKQLGFIAQEVEQVFPSLISEHDVAPGEGKEGHVPVMKKAIKDAWAPILVKALQEAITKIETLETEVAALKAK